MITTLPQKRVKSPSPNRSRRGKIRPDTCKSSPIVLATHAPTRQQGVYEPMTEREVAMRLALLLSQDSGVVKCKVDGLWWIDHHSPNFRWKAEMISEPSGDGCLYQTWRIHGVGVSQADVEKVAAALPVLF